ncbi:hypothetical protein ABT143_25085 [Streptomyces sp. NPDC002033]|uniref:hypothetical protein n=1 Tax=unclassified Streptomyces TaxID=2593676 RepID=UPI00332CDEDE
MVEKTEGTPRALRISFEFRVLRAVRRNIHGAKIDKALNTMTERVLLLAGDVFPAADRAVVSGEWIYDWTNWRREYALGDGEPRLVAEPGNEDEDEGPGTPRALRIGFEFKVPLGFPSIRSTEFDRALDAMTERVLGLAEGLFPWAATATVRRQWLYTWTDDQDERPRPLAANEFNTPE